LGGVAVKIPFVSSGDPYWRVIAVVQWTTLLREKGDLVATASLPLSLSNQHFAFTSTSTAERNAPQGPENALLSKSL